MAVVKGFEPEGGERLLVAAAGLTNSLKSSSSHSSSSVGLDMGRPEQGRLLLRESSQFLPLPYYCYADATFWGF